MEGKIPLNLIVATCNNMGIGKAGSMPWPRLPGESKYFQAVTTRCRDPVGPDEVLSDQSFPYRVSAVAYGHLNMLLLDCGDIPGCLYSRVVCHRFAKQNAVLIGRKTWESIPAERRPLKNRLNVVVSRTLDNRQVPSGVHVFPSFDAAMNFLSESEIANTIETIWDIGGRDIYQLGLAHPAFHRLYLTRILAEYDCDVHFPEVDWTKFVRVKDPDVPVDEREEKGMKYHFEVFERVQRN